MAEDGARTAAERLLDFIRESPSMFHTADSIRRRLDAAGFTYCAEGSAWDVCPGGCYYTLRNNSSIVAWRVGAQVHAGAAAGSAGFTCGVDASTSSGYHFQLAAAHSDSPTFKLKSVPEHGGPESYLRLNVEAYGSMIAYSWFDRPLSLAGRVFVRADGTGASGSNGADGAAAARIESRLVALDRDIALIPSLAIHMNREVNRGFSPNRAIDLCPLISGGDLSEGAIMRMVAGELNVEPESIVAHDLFLVNRQEPFIWGGEGASAGNCASASAPAFTSTSEPAEFISAPKLDDLMCAFTALEGFLAGAPQNDDAVCVYACFDNEEVGSGTKQGALSTFLRDCLVRVNAGLGGSAEDLRRALASSLLVSCDNAHALHPNHPEVADPGNSPLMNGGIVIKEAANQRYCTDALSRAAFAGALDAAGVPWQTFANRSDMDGGHTLGNLSTAQVSVASVDVGCAQLAMHSAFETAGARDVELATDALAAFYRTSLRLNGADAICLG